MVESVEEFGSELQFEPLVKLELFKNAQVPVLDARAVKLIRSTCPESADSGCRERRRIEVETGSRVEVVISRRAGMRVRARDAVRINRIVAVHHITCVRGDVKRRPGLQGYDSVELPVAQPTGGEIVPVHESLPSTERQFPKEVPNEAAANVENGIAHFRRIIIGVLR